MLEMNFWFFIAGLIGFLVSFALGAFAGRELEREESAGLEDTYRSMYYEMKADYNREVEKNAKLREKLSKKNK